MSSDLIERLKGIELTDLYGDEDAKVIQEAITALSPALPDDVAEMCRELSWFRGCDDWELDEFLVEINADRKRFADLLARQQQDIQYLKNIQDELVTQRDAYKLGAKELSDYLMDYCAAKGE